MIAALRSCASRAPRSPSCSRWRSRQSRRCSGGSAWSCRAARLEPARRYERSRPGELIHVDVKKLAHPAPRAPNHRQSSLPRAQHRRPRGGRWEFVHIAIDDTTLLAYAEVLADERRPPPLVPEARARLLSGPRSLSSALMTDNGSPYRCTVHAALLPWFGSIAFEHKALSPSNQRQGRAIHSHDVPRLGLRRRSIGTRLDRTAALSGWLSYYNFSESMAPLATSRPCSLSGAEQPGWVLHLELLLQLYLHRLGVGVAICRGVGHRDVELHLAGLVQLPLLLALCLDQLALARRLRPC